MNTAQNLKLAGEICTALEADQDEGYDLEAGMFGTNFSALVDKLASDRACIDFLLPVVCGEDCIQADLRTLAIGNAIMKGKSGREAIDLAMDTVKS